MLLNYQMTVDHTAVRFAIADIIIYANRGRIVALSPLWKLTPLKSTERWQVCLLRLCGLLLGRLPAKRARAGSLFQSCEMEKNIQCICWRDTTMDTSPCRRRLFRQLRSFSLFNAQVC